MVDSHTHILPNIDDGSSNIDMSVDMLKSLYDQGVDSVVLTPHFYAYLTDIECFESNRASSVRKLKERLAQSDIKMKIYTGAEVLYFDELWRVENLDVLTIQGTRYILIEFPFGPWNRGMLDCVERLLSKNYIPIIAHIDRYLSFPKAKEYILKMYNAGAILQVNVSFAEKFFLKRKILKYFKNNMISLLGTDCHNNETRSPKYKVYTDKIVKCIGEEKMNIIQRKQYGILENAYTID